MIHFSVATLSQNSWNGQSTCSLPPLSLSLSLSLSLRSLSPQPSALSLSLSLSLLLACLLACWGVKAYPTKARESVV